MCQGCCSRCDDVMLIPGQLVRPCPALFLSCAVQQYQHSSKTPHATAAKQASGSGAAVFFLCLPCFSQPELCGGGDHKEIPAAASFLALSPFQCMQQGASGCHITPLDRFKPQVTINESIVPDSGRQSSPFYN
eukprot:1158903-Pelagomonas_calceolata.AAC.21